MTTILLIRHAQAAFGEANYDRLCDRGITQAKLLGEHLGREGREVAAAVCGTLRRHQETAVHTLAGMKSDIAVGSDAQFDEYSADGLLDAYLPLAAKRVPELGGSPAAIRQDRRLFQLALSTVMDLWLSGASGYAGESWEQFQARVRAGLEAAVANLGKTDVLAVFTSAGVIAAAIGQILALAPSATLNLQWRIVNASVTEINFGRSGFALLGFNMTSHLRLAGADEFLTYR